MEAEFLTLLIAHILGVSLFGKFEAESPWWRLILKWTIILLLTWATYTLFGHLGSFFMLAFLFAVSLTFHFVWCRQNGIHPLKATPRKKYYQLRKWTWTE